MYNFLYKTVFESQYKSHEMKNCGKNCVSCPYLLRASLYQFKRVKTTFLLKKYFNCESSNLIYVVICQGCQEEYIGETGFLVKERINIYSQQLQQPQQLKNIYVPVETESSICFLFSRLLKKIKH